MTLVQALSSAKTEEDVKDAYVKAIGLKNYTKGQVDIQAPNVWFEAKEAPTAAIAMFAQLLFYVRRARKSGLKHLPPVLAVIDREKAAILETELAMPVLEDDEIDWPKAASGVSKTCIAQVAAHIDGQFSTFAIANQESEFLTQIKSALIDGKIIRTPITRANLRQVFNKWEEMIGRELGVREGQEGDYAELFFADIMHDDVSDETAMNGLSARLGREGGTPVFYLRRGKAYERYQPANLRSYNSFWRIYNRPPAKKDRDYLLERRDMLLPIDEKKFKGAYYTPPHIVNKAYDLLAKTLGEGWQEEYIIWDMCCGVGNLELSHSNPRNLFMSTLDYPDIDNIRVRGLFPGAEIFQYDYLNDDVTDFGEIVYGPNSNVPPALRQALADAKAGKAGAKKILVLINPPYAESGSGIAKGDENKIGVEKSRINISMREMNLGYASKELFVQFLVRIRQELPNSILAMFSTLKYVNAPNFEPFRRVWQAKYLDGFLVHSRAFDSLTGDFPIGFLIWDQSQLEPICNISAVALDRYGVLFGQKTYAARPNSSLLNAWIPAPQARGELALPLSNALTVSSNPRRKLSCEGALGYLFAGNNDLQNASTGTCLTSSIYTGRNGGGSYVLPENLDRSAIVFAVRRLIKPTWLNDRDQFLQPSRELPEEFKSDCLIWMLFNGSNLSAGADGLEWNNRTWSLTNHFIPFTEGEVGANGRFESDFMAKYIKGICFSRQAKAVLDEGRALWTRFHATTFSRRLRDEFRLGRPDAGWYQIRKALEANSENDPVDFSASKAAYTALGDKLRPLVFELGFLPE
jgi:hypothetical protein